MKNPESSSSVFPNTADGYKWITEFIDGCEKREDHRSFTEREVTIPKWKSEIHKSGNMTEQDGNNCLKIDILVTNE